MSSSSNVFTNVVSSGIEQGTEFPMRCRHMIPMQVQTSGAKKNPMRRFMTCTFRGKEACGVFVWLEPQLKGRARDVAIECLVKIARLRLEVACSQARVRKLKTCIIVLLFVFIITVVVLLHAITTTEVRVSHGICKM